MERTWCRKESALGFSGHCATNLLDLWPWTIYLVSPTFSIPIWKICKILNLNCVRVRWKKMYMRHVSWRPSSNRPSLILSWFPSIYASSFWNNSQFMEFVNLWFNPVFATGCVTLSKPLSFWPPVFLSVKGRLELYNLKYSTTFSSNCISSGLFSFKRTKSTTK